MRHYHVMTASARTTITHSLGRAAHTATTKHPSARQVEPRPAARTAHHHHAITATAVHRWNRDRQGSGARNHHDLPPLRGEPIQSRSMPDWLDPPVHLLTWRTYGTWMPGDDRGWVDERNNGYGEPTRTPDPQQHNMAVGQMAAPPFTFSVPLRERVTEILHEACAWRGWPVLALNVRSNHVHLVVAGELGTGNPLTALKARVTSVLWEEGRIPRSASVWSRGGSHRRLRRRSEVEAAVDYVMNRQ